MTNLSKGINQWVKCTPDYIQRLADGTTFDNRKAPKDKRITCEVRVLNHEQKSNYLSLVKTATNVNEAKELSLETEKAVIADNVRNFTNLEYDDENGKSHPVITGEDFYTTQTDKFVTYIGDIIMQDLPLKPDKLDEEGNIIEEGDEKNSEG